MDEAICHGIIMEDLTVWWKIHKLFVDCSRWLCFINGKHGWCMMGTFLSFVNVIILINLTRWRTNFSIHAWLIECILLVTTILQLIWLTSANLISNSYGEMCSELQRETEGCLKVILLSKSQYNYVVWFLDIFPILFTDNLYQVKSEVKFSVTY